MDVWGKFHKALKKEDWPDAVTCINRIIGREPRNPNHYLKKGDISRKMDNRAEAVDCYLKAAS